MSLSLSGEAFAQHLYPEMTREAVIAEMGYPRNRLARGTVEILQYENGIKLTLQNGVLRSVEGVELGTRERVGAKSTSVLPEEKPVPKLAPERVKAELEAIVATTEGTPAPEVTASAAPEPMPDFSNWEMEEEPASAGIPVWLSFPVLYLLSASVLFVSISLGYNFASVSGQGGEIWRVALVFALLSGLIDLVPLSADFAMMLFWGILVLKGVLLVICLRLLTYLRSALPIIEIAGVSMVAHTAVSIWVGAFVITLLHGLFF